MWIPTRKKILKFEALKNPSNMFDISFRSLFDMSCPRCGRGRPYLSPVVSALRPRFMAPSPKLRVLVPIYSWPCGDGDLKQTYHWLVTKYHFLRSFFEALWLGAKAQPLRPVMRQSLVTSYCNGFGNDTPILGHLWVVYVSMTMGQAIFLYHFWTRPCLQAVQGFNFWAWGLCGHFWTLSVWRPSQRSCAWRESPWIPWCWESQLSAVAERKDFSSRYQSLMFSLLPGTFDGKVSFPKNLCSFRGAVEGHWVDTHCESRSSLAAMAESISKQEPNFQNGDGKQFSPGGIKLFLTWGSWSSSSSCIIQFHELQALTAKISRWKGKWNLGSSRYISLGSYAVNFSTVKVGQLVPIGAPGAICERAVSELHQDFAPGTSGQYH